jgi:hypothetical protein
MAAVARLAIARILAWMLLFGGWLLLGAFALHHGPLGLAQFMPQALWLAAVALVQQALGRWPPRPVELQGLVLMAGVALAVGLLAAAWALVAVAAGVALAAAAAVVQRLRQAVAGEPGSPRGPATVAALLAAFGAGDPGALLVAPGAMALLALTLALLMAALVPAAAHQGVGCGRGLFDCALGPVGAGPWSRLAWLAMLPMMATLPAMAAWCRNEGLVAEPRLVVALHLTAMLWPAWVAGLVGRVALALAVPALLLAGAALALAWPVVTGWMLAMSVQAMAWGWLWAAAWAARPPRLDHGTVALSAALFPAATVLVLGAGLSLLPIAPAAALGALPQALGVAAGLLVLVQALRRWRSGRAMRHGASTV